MSTWEFVDPLDKRADCEEDYISPPFGVPAPPETGTSDATGILSDITEI